MSEWVKYTGSDEQIAEMQKSEHGWMTEDGIIVDGSAPILDLLSIGDKYLLCNPHPRREMIKQQADTGQPVWVRYMSHRFEWDAHLGNIMIDYLKTDVTTTPDWDIPNAEYRFTPFEQKI